MVNDQPYNDLVRQAQQANEDERRKLVDRLITQFAEAAYHWARVILENEDIARDAVQEAWLNAYLHLDQLRDSAAFPGWFRQIVLTACYHALRREKPAIPLSEQLSEEAADQPDPGEAIENNERVERIREAVLALPEAERLVTELFYFDDYPQQEIAEVLAVPVTTVKKRLQYARRRLKGLLEPDIVAQLDLLAFDHDGTVAAFDGDLLDDLLTEWVGMLMSNQGLTEAVGLLVGNPARVGSQPQAEAIAAFPVYSSQLSRALK